MGGSNNELGLNLFVKNLLFLNEALLMILGDTPGFKSKRFLVNLLQMGIGNFKNDFWITCIEFYILTIFVASSTN